MTVMRVANVLSSLTVAAVVGASVALADGPTWAWLGLGLVTYLMVLPPHRYAARPPIQNVFNPPPPMDDEDIERLRRRLKQQLQDWRGEAA